MRQRRAETRQGSSAYEGTHKIARRGHEKHPIEETAIIQQHERQRADEQADVDCNQDPISALLSSDVVHTYSGMLRAIGQLIDAER